VQKGNILYHKEKKKVTENIEEKLADIEDRQRRYKIWKTGASGKDIKRA
jgi:chaperonin cofactor prefoldin